ncbi:MAG: hypothetical protein IKF01_03850 [Bacilli bacterium]|nr:hypothetical protein [Bacilli bacterium]
MINTSELFQVTFYIMLIVLVVALIVLVIEAIKTLNKVNGLLDDITNKSKQLDGVFNIIDGATSAVNNFSDSIVGAITNTLTKIIKRKRDKDE